MKLTIILFICILASLPYTSFQEIVKQQQWNKNFESRYVQPASSALVLDTKTIAANGYTFHYVEEGKGLPVILVHGSIADYREWAKQLSAFGKKYRVIAYSRRYHWPNTAPGPDADASLEIQADDLAAIMKAMNISSAHIVGHSYGGSVAVNLALRYPEMVRTLVLAEPGLGGVLGNSPENEEAIKEGQATRAKMKEVFASGNAEQIVNTYASHVAPGTFEKSTAQERQILQENVAAFQLDYNSRRPPFTCQDARKISVPVLVLSGDRSPVGLQRIAEVTAQCIQGSKFVKIPKATHWLQHDQSQTFNATVLGFLAENAK